MVAGRDAILELSRVGFGDFVNDAPVSGRTFLLEDVGGACVPALTKRLTVYRSLVEERCRKIRARLSDAEQFSAELATELRKHRQ